MTDLKADIQQAAARWHAQQIENLKGAPNRASVAPHAVDIKASIKRAAARRHAHRTYVIQDDTPSLDTSFHDHEMDV